MVQSSKFRLERLRSLLTNPPTSTASGSSGSSSGSSTSAQKPQDDTRDRILKELLNQQDDDQGGRLESRNSRILINRVSLTEPPKTTASSSTGNDMLRMVSVCLFFFKVLFQKWLNTCNIFCKRCTKLLLHKRHH